MKIEIEFKPIEKLKKKELDFMNVQRKREYGKSAMMNFRKEDKKAVFILVKDEGKVVAFGMLKPVKVEYKGKKYEILGMGRGLAIKKGREYGRLLQAARIYYMKKKDKTAVAFTDRSNLGFFEKVGFKTKRHLIKRFRYKNPKTGEIVIDNDGDGVYYEGKDKLVSKIIKGKGVAFTNADFW
ncbi:MAG: GNAT family N-acetyltransferase [Nanoarchaeota archaeon]|nr:GNAT family N-acetyltransferase [Nanoarchaeota archaeon]MBU1103142.1 GNAT family N-acetyltransferase [Nanoarchaeota archaeon]MBU1988761.1 GNAT family N-acetyltransferase [Nanoarchaeota archaeon]